MASGSPAERVGFSSPIDNTRNRKSRAATSSAVWSCSRLGPLFRPSVLSASGASVKSSTSTSTCTASGPCGSTASADAAAPAGSLHSESLDSTCNASRSACSRSHAVAHAGSTPSHATSLGWRSGRRSKASASSSAHPGSDSACAMPIQSSAPSVLLSGMFMSKWRSMYSKPGTTSPVRCSAAITESATVQFPPRTSTVSPAAKRGTSRSVSSCRQTITCSRFCTYGRARSGFQS